jgi:hypothetical protein
LVGVVGEVGDSSMSTRAFGIPVDRDDAAELRSIERSLHAAGWSRSKTTGRMLRAWRQLARTVPSYAQIDEYTNDLCVRDALEQILDLCSDTLRRKLRLAIQAADEDFTAATEPDDARLVGRYYRIDDEAGWWWRRMPRSGELAHYLAANAHTAD